MCAALPNFKTIDRTVAEIGRFKGLQNAVGHLRLKAKFHYASWFEACSKLVADLQRAEIWHELAGPRPNSITARPASNQLRTSFEPDNVVEFGFYRTRVWTARGEHWVFITVQHLVGIHVVVSIIRGL